MEQRKEVNILLLGETGVGKSTFINAFANYLTYETLEEAEQGEPICQIPVSFTVTDDNYEERTIRFGEDANEVHQDGRSATQTCRAYVFRYGDKDIRLIDTPGTGDTRGIDQDTKNMENILAFIAYHPNIHGICILLKPNNARLSVMFRFCIKHLLCHLHKSASKNIIFIFTNARGTFYRPGDTLPPLKKMLKEVYDTPPNVEIIFNKKTTYCIDNESFRFMVALRNGITFDMDERKNYSQSWDNSVREYGRLIQYILTLEPHKAKDTISINEARRVIVTLSKPLADISQNIQLNISLLETRMEEVKKQKDDISALVKELYVPKLYFEMVNFDRPRTVCANGSCTEMVTVGGIQKVNCSKYCHDPCYLTDVAANIVNNPGLRYCSAMGWTDGKCLECGCVWEKHMHVYYKLKEVFKKEVDKTVQDKINSKEGAKKAVEVTIKDLEQRRVEFEEEQATITKTSAKFAYFLKSNAISPYNDALKEYLEYLIYLEKSKNEQGAKNEANIKGLEGLLKQYECEIKILSSAMESTDIKITTPISTEQISEMVKALCSLKVNGPVIKLQMDSYNNGRHQEFIYSEKRYQPSKKAKPGKIMELMAGISNKFSTNVGFSDIKLVQPDVI